jgi:hypothetical protein
MSTIITKNSANSGSTPSLLVQGELAINVTDGRLFYGSGSGNVVKEFGITASYAIDALSASYAETASYAPDYLPLTGGTINGDVTVNGTASIAFLNVSYESASVIYSSGSNQFGDASNDVQTLYGTVDIKTGPVLVTGSLDVSEGITGSLLGTASYAINALSSSYALTSTSASHAENTDNAISSSYALTASYVENAQTASYVQTAQTASYVQTAQTASYVLQAVSASYATLAQTANTASYVENAQTASYVLQAVSASYATLAQTANTASYVENAQTASYVENAQTASYVQTAQTASYVLQAVSASFATTASYSNTSTSASHAVNADSSISSSYSNTSTSASHAVNADNTISSSYALTSSYVENAQTASFVTLAQTASYVENAQTASFVTLAQTASFVTLAQTASFVTTAQTASFVTLAQTASYVENAQTASYVENAQTASYVENAQTASYVLQTVSSSFALTASYVNTLNQIVRVGNKIELDNQIGSVVAESFNAGLGNVFIDGSAGTVAATTFIGDLTGTASYATQALSASYAPSAGGAAFPFTGSASITGSLELTGSFSVQDINGKTNIDSLNRQIYGAAPPFPPSAPSVLSIDWGSRTLNDSSGISAISWNSRQLLKSDGTTVTLDWETGAFTGSLFGTASYATQALSASYAPGGAGTPTFPYTGSAIVSGSLEITGSVLVQDINGKTNIDSSTRQLYDAGPPFPPGASSVLSIDWGSRTLNDSNGVSAIAWRDRALYTPNATTAIIWSDNTYLSSDVYQRDYKSAATQDAVSTNSAAYLGDVIESDGSATVIDAAVTEGMLVYLDTNTTWYPVDQANTRASYLLGIAHNLASLPPPPIGPANQTGWILLEGHVVIDDTAQTGPYVAGADHGLPIYIEDSTTTGTMSTIVPTSTGGPNVVRVLGHCYQQNTTTTTQWMMKFRPSNDWVEI